jgi:S-adenosylmethionine decarboxylase
MKDYYHTEINTKKYYGKHLICDVSSCKRESITDINIVGNFLEELVPKIGMKAYGDLWIKKFGEGDDLGISGCRIILTSSITIHTNDKYGDMYLDVFSCLDYDEQIVLNEIDRVFEPLKVNKVILFRGV